MSIDRRMEQMAHEIEMQQLINANSTENNASSVAMCYMIAVAVVTSVLTLIAGCVYMDKGQLEIFMRHSKKWSVVALIAVVLMLSEDVFVIILALSVGCGILLNV